MQALKYAESGAGIPFTPGWRSILSGTPSVGNGQLLGRWWQIGDTNVIRCEMQLVIGSTTTTGNGEWGFSLPGFIFGGAQKFKPVHFGIGFDLEAAGEWWALQHGVGFWSGLASMETGGETYCYTVVESAPTSVGAASNAVETGFPFAWTATDVLTMSVMAEVL